MNREQRERHEQGETDHKTFAVLRISRLDLLWTLPFRIINRELRERREHRGTDQYKLLRLVLQRTLPFSGGKGELSLRGKSSADTPFFVRGFRVFRGENFNEHSL